MSLKTPAIGIDLGTAQSCVAVYRHGKVEIIANDQGDRTTPSHVAFTNTGRLIGDPARAQSIGKPANSVFDVKRLIGRKFDQSTVQSNMPRWPFKVIDVGNEPKIRVRFEGQTKRFTPEEISAMVLSKMKEMAENHLGQKVSDAVIAVPACFNDSQRQATKDAGKIAGLNVLRLINEPSAVALTYGLDKNVQRDEIVLIYDLGAGTCDASVLTIGDRGVIHVLATSGDSGLGGVDFDNRLMEHFLREFTLKHGRDPRSNPRALRRLQTACEHVKRQLSSALVAVAELDRFHDDLDFYARITRARFEDLCGDLFKSTLKPVELVLRSARLDKSLVHRVVLVGGCSRIPKVRQLLQEFFNDKPLSCDVNPDEAVAYGAAVQAAAMTGVQDEVVKGLLLVDITPFSLGIHTVDGLISKVIERNSPVPSEPGWMSRMMSKVAERLSLKLPKFDETMCIVVPGNCPIPYKTRRTFTTTSRRQPAISIQVLAGERVATEINLVYEFELMNISPAPRGVPLVEVTFELDADGILSVSAADKSTTTDEVKEIKIRCEKPGLSKDAIDRMIREADRYKALDEQQRRRVAAGNQLDNHAIGVQPDLPDNGDRLSSEDERQQIEAIIAEAKQSNE